MFDNFSFFFKCHLSSLKTIILTIAYPQSIFEVVVVEVVVVIVVAVVVIVVGIVVVVVVVVILLAVVVVVVLVVGAVGLKIILVGLDQ